jgi:hypothetical protein
MTDPQDPSRLNTEPSDPQTQQAPSRAQNVAKGCGCLTVSVVLATSVAIAAGGDAGAWAAGISGVLFLVMVVATSGSNGFWGLRG